MQKMKEDLSRKVASAQKECLASRNEIKKHIGDKQRLESELEQLRSGNQTPKPLLIPFHTLLIVQGGIEDK